VARRVLRRAAAVTAVSSYVAHRAAEAAGLAPDAILVQPMPLDADRLAGASRGGGGMVTVGRLTAQKRIDLLLDACAVLRSRGRPARLRIVGDGPERRSLEERAAALGIAEQVQFVGRVEPARVPGEIGDADVFVFTAVGEGFGLAAAEAFALGVPVVATDAGGGVTDIVPASGPGRVVPAGNPEALAGAIDELASHPEARGLAAAVGARLKRELAPDAVAGRFEELFRRVANGPRRG
jgi:glycosyltransferase involved in cell wall biosynthesis